MHSAKKKENEKIKIEDSTGLDESVLVKAKYRDLRVGALTDDPHCLARVSSHASEGN